MGDSDPNTAQRDEYTTIPGDGTQLAYRACGPVGKPVIVFVHGYPDNQRVWDRVIAELSDDYRCVRYDVRGAGRSSRPNATAAYTLDHLEADLNAVIDWASPHAPVHLVAHDWGSIQSWEAVTDPALSGRIASFTSISGPCLDHVGHWLRRQWRADRAGLLQQLGKSWYILAFHLPVVPGLVWRAGLGRRWPAIIKSLEGQTLPENPTQSADGAVGIRLYRANVVERLRHPRSRHAQAPVQVIIPLRDPFVGPGFTDGLDEWVDALTVTAIDAGHWGIQTHPQSIAMHCRAFIERQRPAEPNVITAPAADPTARAGA